MVWVLDERDNKIGKYHLTNDATDSPGKVSLCGIKFAEADVRHTSENTPDGALCQTCQQRV